jgi:hypothetical protein
MSLRVIETRSGMRRLLVCLAQARGKDGVVEGLIVHVVEVEVGGVVEAAVVVVEVEVGRVVVVEAMEAMGRTLPENECGRIRIRRVGETIIGRGGMIRRWRRLGLVLLLDDEWLRNVYV